MQLRVSVGISNGLSIMHYDRRIGREAEVSDRLRQDRSVWSKKWKMRRIDFVSKKHKKQYLKQMGDEKKSKKHKEEY